MTPPPQEPDLGHAGPRVLRVSDLNEHLKGVLAGLGRVAVEGEAAGVKRAASGHLYFSLKDRRRGVESVISCAIWRSQVERATRGPLRDGDQVVCHGRLDLYAPRGSYSLIVERVEAVGVGALLAQLEELKRELADKGWFERRRPLPLLPRRIGVVTSRSTAAFQDFLRTRSLRWPLYPVRLRHSAVQGAGAAEELARAIGALDASGVDVIVVCRGGGSLEDLWAFNERVVAEAVWASSVPVVSGVGHETDTTLIDLVADHRAHTPTDAAQRVIPDREALVDRVERAGGELIDTMEAFLEEREELLERLAASQVLRDPAWILERRREELTALGNRAAVAARSRLEEARLRLDGLLRALRGHAPSRRLERDGERLSGLERRLGVPVREGLAAIQARLELAAGRLEAFSPYAVLRRGYSITRRLDGSPLTDLSGLEVGERVETLLASGRLVSEVEELTDEPRGAAGPAPEAEG